MKELLVRGGVGQKQPLVVSDTHPPNYARARNGGMDDRDVVGELGFEDGVEVLRATHCHETIGVGEHREDASFIASFELHTYRHFWQEGRWERMVRRAWVDSGYEPTAAVALSEVTVANSKNI